MSSTEQILAALRDQQQIEPELLDA